MWGPQYWRVYCPMPSLLWYLQTKNSSLKTHEKFTYGKFTDLSVVLFSLTEPKRSILLVEPKNNTLFLLTWLSTFSSFAQLSLTLCNPMDCSTPSFPVHQPLSELAQTHVHQVAMPSNHLILCRPLLLPPSIFPSIRVFSNESVLCIRWTDYWSFSFSISPSNEWIFRTDFL